MDYYPFLLDRKIPVPHIAELYLYIYRYMYLYLYMIFTRIIEIYMHCYRLFLGRKSPANHIGILYIYIYFPKEYIKKSISNTYILNIYAVFSADFN